jgi:hypothetical protein
MDTVVTRCRGWENDKKYINGSDVRRRKHTAARRRRKTDKVVCLFFFCTKIGPKLPDEAPDHRRSPRAEGRKRAPDPRQPPRWGAGQAVESFFFSLA